MQPNALLCVLVEEVPLGPLSFDETRAAARSLTDLLVRLSQLPAPFPLCLALTDQTLAMLSSAPSVWAMIQAGITDQRIELLLTGGIPPLLPLIPANLRVSLLREQRLRLTRLCRRAPTGAWMQGLAWDPGLLPELKAEGIQYTFLSEALFTPSSPGDPSAGPLRIGHEGQHLLVYPVSESHVSPAEAHRWVQSLDHTAEARPRLKTWTFSLERLRWEPQLAQELLELLANVLEHPQQLRPTMPSSGVPSVKACRWPAPACGMPQHLRERLSMAAQLQSLRPRTEPLGTRSSHTGVPAELKITRPFDTSWDALLALYPESERLHQRMLHLSRILQKLWTSAERRRVEGDLTAEQQQQLELLRRSFLGLWHHAFWWPSQAENLYRRSIRNLFCELRLRLQKELDSLLFMDERWVSLELLAPEEAPEKRFLLGTPDLELMLSAQGGAIVELHSKRGLLPISEFPMRRLEPYHLPLLSAGGGIERASRRTNPRSQVAHSDDALRMRTRLQTERHPRALFRDLLLRSGVTPLNLAHDQAPELLSLADQEYEVVRASYERAAAAGTIQVARSCWLGSDDGSARASLRIDKTYRVSDAEGHIRLDITLSNRGNDPLELYYGLECPFTLPLIPAGLTVLTVTETISPGSLEVPKNAEQEVRPFPSERAGCLAGVQGVRLSGAAGDRRVVVELKGDKAPVLYWFPHETVLPDETGHYMIESNGIVLTLVWKVALWGQEKVELHVDLNIT